MNDTELVLTVVVSTLVILLLIAGIIIAISMATRQRLRQTMQFAATELEYQKELRSAETEIREEVMTQLSRELHDNIGQLLTVMRLTIENKKIDYPDMEHVLLPVEQTLENVTDQVRMLSRSLNNDYVKRQGLFFSLYHEVQRLAQLPHPSVHYENEAEHTTLDANQQLMVFRIFQEIISNALKHSRAQNIDIRLRDNGNFLLEIKDDGRGFDYDSLIQTSGASGLINIRKRAAMAGLNVEVRTQPGQGCAYILSGGDGSFDFSEHSLP